MNALEAPDLFKWLYMPSDSIELPNLLEASSKYNIPSNIIIIKYVELLIKAGLSTVEITGILATYNISIISEIMQKLIEAPPYINVHESYPDGLTNLVKIELPNSDRQMGNLSQARHSDSYSYNESKQKHQHYPIVDPELGRAKTDMYVCKHQECMKKFDVQGSLIRHLIENDAYTKYFHKNHENAIENQRLTPDMILRHRITKCPSHVCNRKYHDTPEKLIIHLKLLGIEPFWVKGETYHYDYEKHVIVGIQTHDTSKPDPTHDIIIVDKYIYRSEHCVSCLDQIPDLVFRDCFHSNMCLDCYKQLNIKLCPECRGPIKNVYPY